MKNLSFLFAFFCMSASLHAASNYGIRIGGVYVTSDNCWNVSGGGIATAGADGKISYDPSTNVLTLRGAYVDCQSNNGIYISSSVAHGLRIVLEGDNYFYNINGVAMSVHHSTNSSYYSPDTYIQGTGTLTFPEGQGDITTSEQAYLCIGDGTVGGAGDGGCTINADAIYSLKDSEGKRGGYLEITDGCVNLRGFSYGTVYGFNWVYNGATDQAYLPEGARYDTYYDSVNDYCLIDSKGNRVTGEVKLGWRRYGLTVGGIDVHVKNYTDIKGLSITSGNVSYNPSSKKLTFNNATVDVSKRLVWSQCIDNYGQDLTVSVTGECLLTRIAYKAGQDDTPVITSEGNLTFSGTGSLTVEGYQSYGIKMADGKGLTLKFNEVENFRLRDCYGIEMGDGTLELNSSSVSVYDARHIGDLKMINTEFYDGKQIIWDPEQKVIRFHYSNNQPMNFSFKKVTSKYGVFIAGHELNDVNAENFYYYNTKGKLTCEDKGTSLYVNMDGFTGDGLNTYNTMQVRPNCPFDQIAIFLAEGTDNRLTNTTGVALYTYKSVEVLGPGKLLFPGSIYTYGNSPLSFTDNAVVEAKDICSKEDGGQLIFGNCDVSLSGYSDSSTYATVRGFSEVILDNTYFVQPDDYTKPMDVYYNEEKQQLLSIDGDEVYTKAVRVKTFESCGLYVNGLEVNTFNCKDIPFDNKISGRLSYDPATETLTLDNLNAWSMHVIDDSRRDTLFFHLTGQNTLKGDLDIDMSFDRSKPLEMIVVAGNAPNNRSSLEASWISPQASLRLRDCQVKGTRLYYMKPSIVSSNTSELVIQNAHVALEGDDDPTIYTMGGFRSFTLKDAQMVTPENWYYSNTAYKINGYCVIDNFGYANMPIDIRPDKNGGDVNGDGAVDVADVGNIIDVMAGGASEWLAAAADVNGDGVVDVADIATIIDIMAETARRQ